MQLQTSFAIGSTGASWTKVLPGGKILVRQGTKLTRIVFASQEIEQQIDFGREYAGEPVAVFQDHFYEICPDCVYKTPTAALAEPQKLPLPAPFAQFSRTPFIQFDSVVVLLAGGVLCIFYLATLESKTLSDEPLIEDMSDAILLAASSTQFYLVGQNTMQVYDSKTRAFEQKSCQFSAKCQQGAMLPNNEFLCTQPGGFYRIAVESGAATQVFASDALENCHFAPAGTKYGVATDRAGNVLILTTELSQMVSKARVAFQFSFRAGGPTKPQQLPAQAPLEKGKIRKLIGANTHQQGESWTSVANSSTIIVRQGCALTKLDFQSRKVLAAANMKQYERVPMGTLGDRFFEVRQSTITIVDLETMSVVEELLQNPLPVDMFRPSYLQFGSTLVIQARRTILTFLLDTRAWVQLNETPCPEEIFDAMLVMPAQNKLWFVTHHRLVEFDTHLQQFNARTVQFNGLGSFGVMLNATEFLATQDENVVKANLQGQTEVLFETKYMGACYPCTAGRFLLVTNQEGEMEVLETSYAEEASKFKPALSYRFTKK